MTRCSRFYVIGFISKFGALTRRVGVALGCPVNGVTPPFAGRVMAPSSGFAPANQGPGGLK
jgi:hypothetical protein